jgi:hypothetical protein
LALSTINEASPTNRNPVTPEEYLWRKNNSAPTARIWLISPPKLRSPANSAAATKPQESNLARKPSNPPKRARLDLVANIPEKRDRGARHIANPQPIARSARQRYDASAF